MTEKNLLIAAAAFLAWAILKKPKTTPATAAAIAAAQADPMDWLSQIGQP